MPATDPATPILRPLGLIAYEPTWRDMRAFTQTRNPQTADELWLLQHPPVYTLGLAGDPAHLLRSTDIPLVKIDRGGQITYHGPGQAVVYLLIDLQRRHLKVRELVRLIERSVLDLLAGFGIAGHLKDGAPGVYVDGAKIAALGLKISRGCSYHGVSLNVDMDLSPFEAIDPCGYPGLKTVQLKDFGVTDTTEAVLDKLAGALTRQLANTPMAHREEH